MKQIKSGFSLIELLICFSLITLIIGLTIGNINFFNKIIMRSHLDKLYATCVYLQQLAIATNKEQILIFDIHNNSYSFNEHHQKLAKNFMFGFVADAKGPPSAPNAAINGPITFKSSQILFKPTGIIGSGTVYFVDRAQQAMYALSSGVSQVSFLRKYRYDNKWHEFI